MPRLQSVLDHVAIAVPDAALASARWRDELGGRMAGAGATDHFASRQLRYAGGGRLELLSPPPHAPPDNFVRRFLERFGSRIHHVTLMVDDLPAAIDTVEEAGLQTVDVSLDDPAWREAFLRPRQTGGIVVQLASSNRTYEAWAAAQGIAPEPVPDSAARLLGARLRHPDLDAAHALWSLLGAEATTADGGLHCSWPDSPLTLRVEEGSPAGPVALRFAGAPTLPTEEGMGPAVEVEQAAA